MQDVTVPTRKWAVVPAMGLVAFAFQITSGASTPQMAIMIALAASFHMTAMTLRDAELRALTEAHSLNAKDIFAYGASLLFDALVLFGLITGAGHLMPWGSFLTTALVVALLIPIVAYLVTRRYYDPGQARAGLRAPHLLGVMLLVVLAAAFWAAPGVQMPSGAQPYVWLILLSAINAPMDPTTKFTGLARTMRYIMLAGTIGLLIWNYLNIA